jgi:hypothetical protein
MTRQTDTQEQTMTNDVTVTVPRYSNAHLDLALAGDNVREAIALVGANDGEVYPERFAREDRERQQAQRAHALRIAALQVTA